MMKTTAKFPLWQFYKCAMWLCIFSPLIALALFYAFILQCRFEHGTWPGEGGPDRSGIGADALQTLFGLSLFFIPIGLINGLCMLGGWIAFGKSSKPWRSFGIAFTPLVLACLIAYGDIGGFIQWYFFYSN